VPPPKEAVVDSIELWPESMVPGVALIVGGVRAELTVTPTGAELTVVGELSVTWSTKCQVPTVDRGPTWREGREEVVQLKRDPR